MLDKFVVAIQRSVSTPPQCQIIFHRSCHQCSKIDSVRNAAVEDVGVAAPINQTRSTDSEVTDFRSEDGVKESNSLFTEGDPSLEHNDYKGCDHRNRTGAAEPVQLSGSPDSVLGFFVPSHVKREVSIPERHGVVVPKINVDQVGVLHVDEPHEETTYKEEYRRGLEETGAKLDQWMKQRWGLSGEQWEQVWGNIGIMAWIVIV